MVPTISFRLLYGLLILHHDRRQILGLGVTAHPTAEWISHQLTEAYGWKIAPRYIIRDRDAVYGDVFIRFNTSAFHLIATEGRTWPEVRKGLETVMAFTKRGLRSHSKRLATTNAFRNKKRSAKILSVTSTSIVEGPSSFMKTKTLRYASVKVWRLRCFLSLRADVVYPARLEKAGAGMRASMKVNSVRKRGVV